MEIPARKAEKQPVSAITSATADGHRTPCLSAADTAARWILRIVAPTQSVNLLDDKIHGFAFPGEKRSWVKTVRWKVSSAATQETVPLLTPQKTSAFVLSPVNQVMTNVPRGSDADCLVESIAIYATKQKVHPSGPSVPKTATKAANPVSASCRWPALSIKSVPKPAMQL